MTTTYTPTSQIANDPAGILWLEKKEGQIGKTTLADIKDALDEYKTNFNAGNVSKAEILTLYRAFPDSPTYKQAAVGIQKMDMVDPLVIGGPASVEMIDREGHLITTNALSKAFQKFMDNQRTRNVMVLHSDVQVGWALPAYITKGGQIFKSGVGENGLFFICELRDDTSIAKKVADQINQGTLKSYSIAGSATKIQNMKKGETPYMQVDEMELAEVTICEKGVNQGANFELLKAELPQTGKVDKDQCGYRDATAPEMKLGINCGHCKYFNSETRTCDVVVGDIMPGDYCRLFEAGEEDKPQIQVNRKIVIMRSDNTGKINFKDSFLNWMEKEEDPLKSGKSFHTLNNIAGREAEHHRLLQEYGFPSEPALDSMRYIPVVETETDDDGKPINIIPPWVVNEAGQDLGDKLDEDAPSFKKSIELIEAILQKAARTNRKARQRKGGTQWHQRAPGARAYDPSFTPSEVDTTRSSTSDEIARKRATTIGDVTQIKKPEEVKESVDKANGDFPEQPPRITPQTYTPPSGQNPPTSGPDTGASTKGPSVLDSMKRQFGGAAGAVAGGLGQAAGATRDVVGRGAELGSQAVAGGRQVMERGREQLGAGVQRMGELFGAGKKRLGEAGQAVKRGAIRADLAAGEAGRKVKAGAQEGVRRAVEGGRRVGAAGQEAGERVVAGGRELGRKVAVDARAARRRAAIEGRRAGRGAQEGGRRAKAGAKEAYRRGAEGLGEFGGGLREGFQSYDPATAQFDEIRSGGGQRDQFGGLRRTAAEGRKGRLEGNRGGARRIGQLFGATGRGAAESSMQGAGLAAEGAFRGAREAGRFGRGVARGATPGQAGRTWRTEEQGDDVGSDRKRTLSERAGQWLGERGRERGADVLRESGRGARGFGRGVAPGEWGKRQRAEWDAKGGDKSALETFGRGVGTTARGGGRWGANIPTKGGRELPRFGSRAQEQAHMMNNEGVGRGVTFQPNAHRGASLSERHQLATGLADRINAGESMSPKEWMQVIHHMSQTDDGQRYANFSDIDIKHGDWNKPISFGDMRQHLDRMNVSHGTHGDKGRRSYDQLVNKLKNVTSGRGGGSLKFKAPKTEDDTLNRNYNGEQEEETRRGPRPSARHRRPRQRPSKDSSDYYEGSFPVMNSTDYQSTNSVTDTFKRAFKINV